MPAPRIPSKVQPAPQWSRRNLVPGKTTKQTQKDGAKSKAKSTDEKPDLVNRDPRGVNAHVKVLFEDVLAEPDSMLPAKSVDCLWRNSFFCYNCWKNCIYRVATLFCGVCLATFYGCEMFREAFLHVWFITPFSILFRIVVVHCVAKVWYQFISCAVEPVAQSCGRFFIHCGNTSKRGPVLPTHRKGPRVAPNSKSPTKKTTFAQKVKPIAKATLVKPAVSKNTSGGGAKSLKHV